MGARPSSFKADVAAAVVDPVLSSTRMWSAQQQAIIDEFRTGRRHVVVRARAGTGKTTTICGGVEVAPEEFILVTSFTRRITDELKTRLEGTKATVTSLHGVGNQALTRSAAWRKARVADDRARQLTDAVCPPKIYASTRRNISKLHTKARELYPHCTGPEELVELALVNDCVQPGEAVETICEYAYLAMLKAMEPVTGIDFADMIYLPLRLGLVRPRFDLIVVDECQDMSDPQLEIAQLSLEQHGRMVVVGDDRQAIFGFRGADSGSLDRLKSELGAEEFGLTTTYRCGTTIVDLAQRLVPDIVAQADAHEGSVQHVDAVALFSKVRPGDFILSRTNAPLVRIVMALLRAGQRAKVEGRDIGKHLLGLHQRFCKYGDIADIETWELNLDDWMAREIARADKADLPARADMVRDQGDTLRAISDGARNTSEIADRIAALFEDTDGRRDFVIGSTVHKAKGLEADRVWMLVDTFGMAVACMCGHRHGRGASACAKCECRDYRPQTQAALEEENVRYVAITRAKQDLFLVMGGR